MNIAPTNSPSQLIPHSLDKNPLKDMVILEHLKPGNRSMEHILIILADIEASIITHLRRVLGVEYEFNVRICHDIERVRVLGERGLEELARTTLETLPRVRPEDLRSGSVVEYLRAFDAEVG